MLIRQGARNGHDLREISFIPHVSRAVDGSCVMKIGRTHVFCTALFEKNLQEKMSVEIGALPGSAFPRRARERETLSLETLDLQESLARSLMLVLDFEAFSDLGIRVDCDVLQDDGSIRSACISGASVALALAIQKVAHLNVFSHPPLLSQIAGISCGIVKGELIVDLDQEESCQADIIGEFVFNVEKKMLDLRMTGRRCPISMAQCNAIADIASKRVHSILEAQKTILEDLKSILKDGDKRF